MTNININMDMDMDMVTNKDSVTDKEINNIVFSAGSMGGLAFIGAWRALEERGLTTCISNFSGCSMGSVMALLTTLGYSAEELETLACTFRYKDLNDIQILKTFENLGLDTGDKMERLLVELLKRKIGMDCITFQQHYRITGRTLWINSSCVEKDKCYYFSWKTTPKMSVVKAVRMSIALPVIIAPVRYHGRTFIDGGFHDPCPVKMFPVNNTIILRIQNDHSISSEEHDFVKHTGMIIQSIYGRLYTALLPKLEKYRMVWFNTGIAGFTLDIKRKERKKLITLGFDIFNVYLTETDKNIGN